VIIFQSALSINSYKNALESSLLGFYAIVLHKIHLDGFQIYFTLNSKKIITK